MTELAMDELMLVDPATAVEVRKDGLMLCPRWRMMLADAIGKNLLMVCF